MRFLILSLILPSFSFALECQSTSDCGSARCIHASDLIKVCLERPTPKKDNDVTRQYKQLVFDAEDAKYGREEGL